ncbi:Immunoglobulin-like domain [Trinorchestia longiramus]|nr:Immunoglobulin-like domain [Trinorchestia longiramus]
MGPVWEFGGEGEWKHGAATATAARATFALRRRMRRSEDRSQLSLMKDHRQNFSISAKNFRQLSDNEDERADASYKSPSNQNPKKYVGANSLRPKLGGLKSSLINFEGISKLDGLSLYQNTSYSSPEEFQSKKNGDKGLAFVNGQSIGRKQTQDSPRQGFNSALDRNKVNFKSQGPLAARTRWKKQNKNKHGGGGHWVEYDFDEGTSTTTADPLLPENPVGLKNPNLLVGPWVEEPTVRKSKAYFGGQNNTLVNAQIGTTAKLPCLIFNRDDHETVSWIRSRDHHLITVGRQTYSSDNRFSVNFNRHLSV